MLRFYGYEVLIGVWAIVAIVGLGVAVAYEIAQFRNAGGAFGDLPAAFISREREASLDGVGLDIADSEIEWLIGQIVTERAARLVAEDRADWVEAELEVVQEENERLRFLQIGQ